jgi:hypothetical protein
MKRLLQLLLWSALAWSGAVAGETRFSFGVLASAGAWASEDARLRAAIEHGDSINLAFLVAQGMKTAEQACTNTVYQRRMDFFGASKHGLVLSLSANDWSTCETANGPATALGRLTHLREHFFSDEFSLGGTRLPLVRQSTEAKFHNFVENARWEIGEVMFATINLPQKNNHFIPGAGRNGEFDDRLVANREWLRRIFTHASLKKRQAVVLFSDANPLVRTPGARRDGYAEIRQHILSLAGRFKGKVVIVHAQEPALAGIPAITWRGNVGHIGITHGWMEITVDPSRSALFAARLPVVRENQ